MSLCRTYTRDTTLIYTIKPYMLRYNSSYKARANNLGLGARLATKYFINSMLKSTINVKVFAVFIVFTCT